MAVFTHSTLCIENWTLAFPFNPRGAKDHHRGKHNQSETTRKDVESPLQKPINYAASDYWFIQLNNIIPRKQSFEHILRNTRLLEVSFVFKGAFGASSTRAGAKFINRPISHNLFVAIN